MASKLKPNTHQWQVGAPFKRFSAEEAQKAVDQADGDALTLTEQARDKNHYLHDAYEWDDSKAAASHRYYTSKRIIRSIMLVRPEKTPTGEFGVVRAYPSITVNKERKFVHMNVALRNEASRAFMVTRAYTELESWRERYNYLRELDEVFSSIDPKLESMRELGSEERSD
jgi:hypothetical protein